MTRAQLPGRVLVLTILALLVAERIAGAGAQPWFAPLALVLLGLSAVLGRCERRSMVRALRGAIHIGALFLAAGAESGARPAGALAGGSGDGDRLWVGRVIGCPRPAAGNLARAQLAVAWTRPASSATPLAAGAHVPA